MEGTIGFCKPDNDVVVALCVCLDSCFVLCPDEKGQCVLPQSLPCQGLQDHVGGVAIEAEDLLALQETDGLEGLVGVEVALEKMPLRRVELPGAANRHGRGRKE